MSSAIQINILSIQISFTSGKTRPTMRLSIGSAILLLVTASDTVFAQCENGVYAYVASALKGYPSATSFCSSRFPVPARTSTTTLHTTVTTTVTTATATTTAATVTVR